MDRLHPQDTIRRTLIVPGSPERAFTVFTGAFGSWYPREYTWSGDDLTFIGIEPWKGGRCFEVGPHNFTCEWGRVLAWEPPHRLVITWQVGYERTPVPNPTKASEVEVRFTPDTDASTRVTFEHRHLSRHEPNGLEYREALSAPEGWDYILGRYATTVGEP